MKKKIFLGFSANPARHLVLDGNIGTKRLVEKNTIHLEGSGVNAARALADEGIEVLLSVLVGSDAEEDDRLLEMRKLLKLLMEKQPIIQVSELPVLDRCHYAWVEVDSSLPEGYRILSDKGRLWPDLVDDACRTISISAEGSDGALLMAIRPEELLFARAAARAVGKSKTILGLHGTSLMRDDLLPEFLATADVMVMNRAEYDILQKAGWNFEKLHYKGLKLVVVTRDKSDGIFSLDNKEGSFTVRPVEEVCADGAGDAFTGLFAAHYLEKLPQDVLSCSEILGECAALVSDRLVRSQMTMPV